MRPMSADSLYDLDAARTDEQRALHGASSRRDGVCIFCPEHVAAYQRQPIELSGEHWYVQAQRLPVRGHGRALPDRPAPPRASPSTSCPTRRAPSCGRSSARSKAQLAPLATATVERSGDMRLNGGSVAHLHTHFVALGAGPGGDRALPGQRARVRRDATGSSSRSCCTPGNTALKSRNSAL